MIMKTSIKTKAMRGVFWTFIEAFGARLIQFIIGIVLARILLPEEFGLIGMLVIFFAITQVFLDSGFGAALIQKQNAAHVDFCSIFYFNILVGIISSGIICLTAPSIALFFDQPTLEPLAKVMSSIIIINSFGLIQNTILRKKIDFKGITFATLLAGLVSGCVGIILALKGFGVWSLAIQQITSAMMRTSMLWFINPWRPSLKFSIDSLKEMFGFGSRLLASSLLNRLFDNIYLIVIGKIFTPTDLGYFIRARQFQELPSQSLSGIVAKVSFPVFSAIKENPMRLKTGFKKALTTLVLINFPMMIGLLVVARPLVLVLLTEKWIECVSYLQILSLVGLLYPLHLMNLNVLQALGRSDLFLKLEIFKKVLIIINIVVTYRWGIIAMIWGQVLVSVVSYYINSYYNSELIGYSMYEQLIDISKYLLSGILMGCGVFGLTFLPFSSMGLLLLSQVAVGVVLYCVICILLKLSAFIEIFNEIKKNIARVVPS